MDRVQSLQILSGLVTLSVIAGCGGQVSTPPNQVSAPSTYQYSGPSANEFSSFADVVTDNAGNVLNRTVNMTVTSVASDGSFSASWVDPSGAVNMSGTVDQTFYPTVTQYNAAGQATSSVVTPYGGSPTSCTLSPHNGDAPATLTQLDQWSLTYTQTCGATSVPVTAIGAFQDIEPLIVPAGNFNAYRFAYVLTYTVNGVAVSDYVTTWYNATAVDTRLLQQSDFFVYNGTVPQGTIVSDVKSLSSYR